MFGRQFQKRHAARAAYSDRAFGAASLNASVAS